MPHLARLCEFMLPSQALRLAGKRTQLPGMNESVTLRARHRAQVQVMSALRALSNDGFRRRRHRIAYDAVTRYGPSTSSGLAAVSWNAIRRPTNKITRPISP